MRTSPLYVCFSVCLPVCVSVLSPSHTSLSFVRCPIVDARQTDRQTDRERRKAGWAAAACKRLARVCLRVCLPACPGVSLGCLLAVLTPHHSTPHHTTQLRRGRDVACVDESDVCSWWMGWCVCVCSQLRAYVTTDSTRTATHCVRGCLCAGSLRRCSSAVDGMCVCVCVCA